MERNAGRGERRERSVYWSENDTERKGQGMWERHSNSKVRRGGRGGGRGKGWARWERVDVIDVWTNLDRFSICCHFQQDRLLRGMNRVKDKSFDHDAMCATDVFVCVCVWVLIFKHIPTHTFCMDKCKHTASGGKKECVCLPSDDYARQHRACRSYWGKQLKKLDVDSRYMLISQYFQSYNGVLDIIKITEKGD